MRGTIVIAVLVLALAGTMAVRPEPPQFCKDAKIDPFCAVLPGQGLPLPPPVEDDVMFDVWVMQAPVWEFVPGLGKFTSFVKLIHTAVGLVNQQSNQSYTMEFEGVFESPNATFPWLRANASEPGGEEITWCNAGAICWGEGITWSYYTTTLQKVATMNGTVFNKLIGWIPIENDTNSLWYETFGVYANWEHGYQSKQYQASYTCDDFAWKAFGALMYWGAEFTPGLEIKRDFLNFYTNDSAPVLVDISDPSTYKDVSEFYQKFDINGAASKCDDLTGDLKELCEAQAAILLTEFFFEEDKYVYHNEQYYSIDEVYLGFDWHYDPQPFTPVDPYIDIEARLQAEERKALKES